MAASNQTAISNTNTYAYDNVQDTNYVSGQSVDVDYHSTEAAAAAEMKYPLYVCQIHAGEGNLHVWTTHLRGNDLLLTCTQRGTYPDPQVRRGSLSVT